MMPLVPLTVRLPFVGSYFVAVRGLAGLFSAVNSVLILVSLLISSIIILALTGVCRGEHLLCGRSGSLILSGQSRCVLLNRSRVDCVLSLKVAATAEGNFKRKIYST